jgi:transposase
LLNSYTINEALSGNLRKLNGFLHLSDGVKWHRSPQFKQCCDQYNIKLCESSGYSPDFNAIELFWNIIKQKTKSKNPKSQRELENAIDDTLNDLSLNVIQACKKQDSESILYSNYLIK